MSAENVTSSQLPKEKSSKEKNEWVELMGNKLILKKIESGNKTSSSVSHAKHKYAEIGDAIYVDYIARSLYPSSSSGPDADLATYPLVNYLENKKDSINYAENKIFINKQDCLVTLGDGDVVPVLEMAMRFIPLNGCGIVRSDARFGYGPHGFHPNSTNASENAYSCHPSNSSVEIQVRIKSIISSESTLFSSPRFIIERGNSKKQMGNEAFNMEQNSSRALSIYQSSAKLLRSLLDVMNTESQDINNPKETSKTKLEIQREVKGILIDCLNNASLVHFKNGDYCKAKEIATDVLAGYDVNNVRALFRAAKAAMMDPSGSYEEAKAAIDAATDILGEEDKEVKRLLNEWKRRKRHHRMKEKAMFSKMIKGKKENKREGKANASSSKLQPKEANRDRKDEDDEINETSSSEGHDLTKNLHGSNSQLVASIVSILLFVFIAFLIQKYSDN